MDRETVWIKSSPVTRYQWARVLLVTALIILVGGCSSLVLILYNLPSPEKTLTTFCDALQENDDQVAWVQLSPQFQRAATHPLFTDFFSGLSTCTLGKSVQNANQATLALQLTFPDHKLTESVALKQRSDGNWKIESETSFSAIQQLLRGFCTTLQQGDYTNAYQRLSLNLQTKMTASQFSLLFPHIAFCNYTGLTFLQNQYQITFLLSSPSGTVDTNSAILTQVQGNWKIDDFANLPTKTLAAFCSALKAGAYQDAYDQTSTAFQGGQPEGKFARDFSNLSSCTYSPPAFVSGNLRTELKFFTKNGLTFPYVGMLVRDSNNARWKIDQIVNFPEQVLAQFCADLANQDYQDAYNQLTAAKKAQISLVAFAQNYSSVARCQFTFPSQLSSQATSTITYTLIDRTTSKQVAMLTEVSTDDWKIQQLLNP